MWKKYFNVVGIVPGPVIVYGFGQVDFSRDDLQVDVCKKLFEADCRYLQITADGLKELYGIQPKEESTTPDTSTPKKRGRRKKE